MHKLTSTLKPKIGHRERFDDGIYACQGTYGHNKKVAAGMAEGLAKRYRYKVRLTEKIVRVTGEHGLIRKPIYLIWVKVK